MARCDICKGPHPTDLCDTAQRSVAADSVQPGAVAAADLAPRRALDVGAEIDNYRLTRQLGKGATARVFLGEHLVTGETVAVKALAPVLHGDPATVRRFLAEARVTQLLLHENIVRIHDIGVFEGWQHFIVMEHVVGTSLAVEAEHGPMPLDRMAAIAVQVCVGLHVAHQRGVVHRDLKPANIYCVRRPDGEGVKIVDFGLARRSHIDFGEHRTAVGTILGTPFYMAPEQAAGVAVDARADIYSLGVILFQLATGRLPFVDPTFAGQLDAHATAPPPAPRSIHPAVPEGFEEVILTCLAKSPADRYASMAEVGRALAEAVQRPSARLKRPAEAAATPSAAERQHVRYAVSVEVRVEADAGASPVGPDQLGPSAAPAARARAVDLSKSGAFIALVGPLPGLFSRIRLHLPGASEPVEAEVVRVEPGDGSTRRGIGVHFEALRREQEAAVTALLPLPARGDAATAAGDPEAAQVLSTFASRAADDLYGLIGVSPETDARSACEACGRLLAELAPGRFPAANPAQRSQLAALQEQVLAAEQLLGDPVRRAGYDARRGNFVGVARCLADGLSIEVLGLLREAFLRDRAAAAEAAPPHRPSTDDAERGGAMPDALAALDRALRTDPLNLDLQRRYWAVKRQVLDRT